ncbi:Transposable element Tcb2 transposase-like [Operophtera brumata]|uniref:Transposable element Tcb2 transposase-like n=1 Tax=Operophtera brumata TaxID=104452 RepID=A0A0L7K4G3_OPEBR|nr:Transposable element Tcb2 transposase-like [Operophtera brumata]
MLVGTCKTYIDKDHDFSGTRHQYASYCKNGGCDVTNGPEGEAIRYEETGNHLRRPGTGRPRCTSAREDRYIVSTELRNHHQNAVEVECNSFFRPEGTTLVTVQ